MMTHDDSIHSCGDTCQRRACVLRRELTAMTEHRDGLRAGIDYASDQLTKVTEQRDHWKARCIQQNKDLGYELRDPNGTIWSECKRLQCELTKVKEQRDRLAEALINCMPFISGEGCGEYSDAKEALQSVNKQTETKTK